MSKRTTAQGLARRLTMPATLPTTPTSSPGVDMPQARNPSRFRAAGAIPRITEKDLQRRALDLLHATGWWTFCDRLAVRSDPGWLDVTAVHTGMQRTIFIEVKTERGKLRTGQEMWLMVHQKAGNETFILRPSTWDEFVACVVPPEMVPSQPSVRTVGRQMSSRRSPPLVIEGEESR